MLNNKESLKGKPVTIVYVIEDEELFNKSNPMLYKHNGLVVTGCAASDLMDGEIEYVCSVINQLDKELEAHEVTRALYFDLLMEVKNKYPGESRHETAKRYIQQEAATCSDPSKEAKP